MPDHDQDPNSANVLRRITAANGPTTAFPLPVHRAFRKSLAKIADELFEIELDITSVEDTRLRQSEAIQIDIPNPVFYRITGPKGGPGLAVISASLAKSLVELQTVGEISKQSDATRSMTESMAMLSHDYINTVLGDLSDQMAIVDGEEWVVEHHLGDPIFDLHRLPLEIPDIHYRMLRGEFSFGQGGPVAHLAVVLPASPTSSGSVELGNQTVNADRVWKDRLQKVVKETTVAVNGILHRDQLTVDAVRNLAVGDIFPLPDGAETRIRVEGLDGVILGVGKIGMLGLSKAIRIRHVGDLTELDEPAKADHGVAPDDVQQETIFPSPIDPSLVSGDLGIQDLGSVPPSPLALDDLPELDIATG